MELLSLTEDRWLNAKQAEALDQTMSQPPIKTKTRDLPSRKESSDETKKPDCSKD